MKRASRRASEDLRPVYKRSDFGTLVRGKYAQRVIEATNVVVLIRRSPRRSQMIGPSTKRC